MSNLADKVFCCLAGCVSVLIDSPVHSCPKEDRCCIALLVKVIRGLRDGREVDTGSLGNQVEIWMSEKEPTEPFQILKRFFEESRPCALDFFRGFHFLPSKRRNCDCEVIVIPSPSSLAGRGSENLPVRILRPANLPRTMLLKVEGKLYILECGLASNDGGKYIAFFREGYGLFAYGDYVKREILINETGLVWHMVFYKKCPEALAAPAIEESSIPGGPGASTEQI